MGERSAEIATKVTHHMTGPKQNETFDLPLMKRLLGEPVLLGDETMENFDEFAIAVASSLEPGDMAAHVLVFQYIMETWVEMRLRRLQGHLNRLHGVNVDNHSELAKTLGTSEAEAKAFAAQQRAHAALTATDNLLTQTTKRAQGILNQIALHRIALAERIRVQIDIEERRLKIKGLETAKAARDSPSDHAAKKEAADASA